MYTTLISAQELRALQASGAAVMVFDCSFDLMNPTAGPEQYRAEHLPGAVYAHLDTALSDKGAADAASGGRHPLPRREKFAAWLGSVGFTNDMQAVVYDRNGANYCGRLWWMLKWAGHEPVAVLDGGLQAWKAAGGAVATAEEAPLDPVVFELLPALRRLVGPDEVLSGLNREKGLTIVDARAAPRYRGEVEPLDPVAGHIPGALNRPFADNIGPDGRFKPAAQLRSEFIALLDGHELDGVVHQCGSGVSAVPNLVAMEVAGLGPTALYAGSWSDWCSDPSRPVTKG